ncbi:MAG: hypothetical protein V3U71_10680 [Cocleimonas sp.]
MKKIFSFILLLLIVGGAIALVINKVKNKPTIEHIDQQFPVKAVEFITAAKIPFRARAMAFGHIEPATILKAKSEVSGKVSYLHPALKKGSSLKKGTVVLRIEPTTYKLTLSQSKAGLVGSQSTLKQLETEEISAKRTLNISQKNLNVGYKELNRIKSLWVKRLIARSTLDKEEQKVLSLRQQVQDIEGKLAGYASRKTATRAQIKQSKSQVDQSKDTLGRTEIRLPFDARIGAVSVDKGEFVSAGGLLFEALGVQAVEINAQLPIKQLRPLVTGLSKKGEGVNFKSPEGVQVVLKNMQLEARVRLVGDSSGAAIWQGQLVRLSESVDPTRDTLGLVILVNKPYENIIPGKRPPLLKGMYTSVELLSPAKPTLVVPRKSVHQGRVYVVATKEGKSVLEIIPVHVLFQEGEMLVLDVKKDAALIGKKIIITDVIPVMEGLPLKVIEATEYQKQLVENALGTLEKTLWMINND